jgi:TPR repeat protein
MRMRSSISRNIIAGFVLISSLTHYLHATSFQKGVELFENEQFEESVKYLLPSSNKGDLIAQHYINYLSKLENSPLQDKNEIKFSFDSMLEPVRTKHWLEASLALLEFKKTPKKSFKILDELSSHNPHANILLGDLLSAGKIKKYVFNKKPQDFYKKAIELGDYRGAMKLHALGIKIEFTNAMDSYSNGTGKKHEEEKRYYDLFRLLAHGLFGFKKDLDSAALFGLMAAYHGNDKVLLELLNGYTNSKNSRFCLELSAQKDNLDALVALGFYYEHGDSNLGYPKKPEKALELYLLAAEKGSVMGEFNVGVMFHKGIGTKVDLEKAIDYYTRAAKKQDKDAIKELGHLYRKLKDYTKALEYFQQGVDLKISDCYIDLSGMYYNGLGVEADSQKGFEIVRKIPSHTPLSLHNMAVFLIQGKCSGGKEEEWNKVEEYLLNSSPEDPHHTSHPVLLGSLYFSDRQRYINPDYTKAFKFLTLAVEKYDSADAHSLLGQMYYFGHGIEESRNKAFEHYLKATGKGQNTAWNHLGVCYMDGGEDIPQNDTKAADCFKKSIELNPSEPWAYANLATLMSEQRGGVKWDEEQYLNLLLKAVECGDESSLHSLGLHYHINDLTLAMAYYQKAVDAGVERSEYNLAFLQLNLEGLTKRKEAFETIRKIAESGNFLEARLGYALLLYIGVKDIIEPQQDASLKLFEEMALEGSKIAQDFYNFLLFHQLTQKHPSLLEMTNQTKEVQKEEKDKNLILDSKEFVESIKIFEEEEDWKKYIEDYSRYNNKEKKKNPSTQEVLKDIKESKINKKILNFLEEGSKKSMRTQDVFSLIGTLIEQEGGSIRPGGKGFKINVGNKTISLHKNHKSGQGNKMSKGRKKEISKLIEEFVDTNKN